MVNSPYDTLAASVRIKDITSCAKNRALLHRIKNNDPGLSYLHICELYDEIDDDPDNFYVREGGDLGWLGYFIGKNETLETLNICHLPTYREQLENFFIGMQRNKSIKGITFFGDGLRGTSLCAINLPHITSISMEDNIDFEEAHNFAVGLHRCKSLVNYFGPITAEIVASLIALPMLESVSLWRNRTLAISRDECMALSRLLLNATKMKLLDISHVGLGNDGLKILAEGLAYNVSLTDGVLDISYNDIGNEGLQALASSIASNTKLRKLILSSNNIGDAGLEALADSLTRNKALHLLSIGGNTAITTTGVGSISRILQSRKSGLEDLCLDRINISDEGGIILANALSSNKSLVSLSLSCDQNGISISDDGLRTLAIGLSRNSQLKTLDLTGNTAITASGLRSLKQCFRSPSCALENLRLYGINIGDEGAHALADALGGNKSLKTLYFGERGMTLNGWGAILKLLCDSSSPHNIQLSNHTLCNLSGYFFTHSGSDVKTRIASWLKLNKDCRTPNLAAKSKILQLFPDLDMVPLFQWNLKPLPLVKRWFETVTSPCDNFAARIRNKELSSIYKFVKGLPVLVVDDLRRDLLTRQVETIRA